MHGSVLLTALQYFGLRFSLSLVTGRSSVHIKNNGIEVSSEQSEMPWLLILLHMHL